MYLAPACTVWLYAGSMLMEYNSIRSSGALLRLGAIMPCFADDGARSRLLRQRERLFRRGIAFPGMAWYPPQRSNSGWMSGPFVVFRH